MHLPSEVQQAIEQLSQGISLKELQKASEFLSTAYRSQRKDSLFLSPLQKIAYLHVRFPATYAVLLYVLQEAVKRISLPIQTFIDLGSGPGTAVLAALNFFALEKITLYEKDPGWLSIQEALLPKELFLQRKFSKVEKEDFEPHDLFIASYFFNEIAFKERFSILTKLWQHTKYLGIFIEPGTPEGFQIIREIREFFIQSGALILAPCTHLKACPMEGDNWCHFGTRIERSSFHRQMKQGSLNFEDEKFSYLIVSKIPGALPRGRVVSIPQKQNRGLLVDVCSEKGIEKEFVKDKKTKIRLGGEFH